MKRLNPEYVSAVSRTVNQCPYFQLLSMSITELGEGTSVMEISLGEKHLQPFGMVHGGVFSSLIDASAFWAVYPLLDVGLGLTTVEMKLNYLSPTLKGKMVARGQCLKLGKTLALGQSEIRDQEGRLLAHGTATLMVLSSLTLGADESLPPKFMPKSKKIAN
jgi:uncharacterized protein (TIGR00369 family)